MRRTRGLSVASSCIADPSADTALKGHAVFRLSLMRHTNSPTQKFDPKSVCNEVAVKVCCADTRVILRRLVYVERWEMALWVGRN